ncbi:MAG: LacI family DNA-binding transcriptional regulator [Tepidisphaeraceae bacterium]
MNRRRKSTRSSITDVSKEAGVSIATVSRVINGHPHVSDDTVRAVHDAIKRTGYHVNTSAAKRDGSRSTGNIAVLFPDANQEALRTPLSGHLIHGIDEGLRLNGLTMIVTGLQPDQSAPSCMLDRKVDGVIVRGSRQAVEMTDILTMFPTVWVFEAGYQPRFELDVVCEDNPWIGAMAARQLCESGHRKLAVLNLVPDHASMRIRRMFFIEESQQLGVPVQAIEAPQADLPKVIDRLLKNDNRPTGLFVPGTDDVVIGVYRELEKRGVKVGRDLELISVNNDVNRLWTLDPSLANIDIQPELIGRAAVDLLLWRLSRLTESRRKIVVPPRFVAGSSPKPAPMPAQ